MTSSGPTAPCASRRLYRCPVAGQTHRIGHFSSGGITSPLPHAPTLELPRHTVESQGVCPLWSRRRRVGLALKPGSSGAQHITPVSPPILDSNRVDEELVAVHLHGLLRRADLLNDVRSRGNPDHGVQAVSATRSRRG